MFAKRKRNIFKGPVLQFAGGSARSGTPSHSRSGSQDRLGRQSSEMPIQEEDEEALEMEDDFDEGDRSTIRRFGDVDEEEVEEVESFTPLVRGPGEEIEERIFEEGEEEAEAEQAAKAEATLATTKA